MTVTELKKKCRELNLKTSGGKQVLIDRIQRVEGNLLSEIILSNTLERDLRTRGKKFPLAGKEQELERILGIRSRSSGHVDFQSFATVPNTELSSCLRNDDLRINLQICNWCTQRRICENVESRALVTSNRVEIHSKFHQEHSDIQTLESWFKGTKFVKSISSKAMLFSNLSDPFKPGFGKMINGRRLFLLPLDEVPKVFLGKSHNWSHLFYSPFLRKTLTVFEALLLNTLAKFHMTFSENTDIEYPTLKELEECFQQLLGPNWAKTSKINLLNTLNQKLFSDESILSRNELLKNLLENSNKSFTSNLLDNRLEMFTNEQISFSQLELGSDKSAILPQLAEFLHDVIQKVKLYLVEKPNEQFFRQRTQCQIFTSEEVQDLELPIQHQILRIESIDGLVDSWCLIDAPMTLNEEDSAPFHHIPADWFDEFEIPETVKNRICSESLSSLKVVNWDDFNKSDNDSAIIMFEPSHIFTANSMSMLLNKYTNSSGDLHSAKRLESLESIMRLIFFSLIDKIDISIPTMRELELGLKNLRLKFSLPAYRRLKPIDCLRELSKDFENFIYYETDPDKNDVVYKRETIQIRLLTPSYIEKKNERKIEHQPLEWAFRYVEQDSEDESGFLKIVKEWHLYRETGRKIVLNEKNISRLSELLNWKEPVGRNQIHNSKFLWISPNVHALLKVKKTGEILAEFIRNRLNQEGVYGTLMIATDSEHEYDLIERLTGVHNARIIDGIVDGQNIVIWTPSATVSEFSPNFLHVGRL